MISVSIPGKIHLIGEHSVVYGEDAILASINLYLKAKISKTKSKEILGLIQYDSAIKDMQSAIEQKIQQKFDIKKIPNYKIEIDKSGIPVGSGLGTSASLSAAFSICLLKFLNIEFNDNDVFEIALEGEKIFHGNPSGGDLAAVLQNGIFLFKNNNGKIKLKNLKITIPASFNNFLLIDSGKPAETTAQMIKIVNQKYETSKTEVIKVFQSQGALTSRLVKVLKKGDSEKFIQVITKAEKNLEKLGVVGENAKTIIRQIENLGGAAKITGAGGIERGSGMILAYHEDLNILIKFAKDSNLKYYPVEISYRGTKY